MTHLCPRSDPASLAAFPSFRDIQVGSRTPDSSNPRRAFAARSTSVLRDVQAAIADFPTIRRTLAGRRPPTLDCPRMRLTAYILPTSLTGTIVTVIALRLPSFSQYIKQVNCQCHRQCSPVGSAASHSFPSILRSHHPRLHVHPVHSRCVVLEISITHRSFPLFQPPLLTRLHRALRRLPSGGISLMGNSTSTTTVVVRDRHILKLIGGSGEFEEIHYSAAGPVFPLFGFSVYHGAMNPFLAACEGSPTRVSDTRLLAKIHELSQFDLRNTGLISISRLAGSLGLLEKTHLTQGRGKDLTNGDGDLTAISPMDVEWRSHMHSPGGNIVEFLQQSSGQSPLRVWMVGILQNHDLKPLEDNAGYVFTTIRPFYSEILQAARAILSNWTVPEDFEFFQSFHFGDVIQASTDTGDPRKDFAKLCFIFNAHGYSSSSFPLGPRRTIFTPLDQMPRKSDHFSSIIPHLIHNQRGRLIDGRSMDDPLQSQVTLPAGEFENGDVILQECMIRRHRHSRHSVTFPWFELRYVYKLS
ncbi:hypothetical protein BV25DRAFT_1837426 [Artomyces pyxidatus]|uniref:Uncharacterized protein n=1 Tax=Artomyces pyxidatus TaxID=48021 RepID=A0ACB8T631_9AGAM|nr:hypothetical protein BV25DRAFT_1837426 [Artomyces pyxidatus]